MSDILLLEPTSSCKRRTFSNLFIKPEKVQRQSLDEIKKRLREIRDHSVGCQDVLVKDLMTVLDAGPGVDVSFADNAYQAVKRIKEIGGTGPLVLNRSAVVTKELMTLLTMEGCAVIESYDDEFQPFENRFTEYWQLPGMLFESLRDSFERPVDLNRIRKKSIQNNGIKGFTGLVGVNTISANDGSVVMLQHMRNIRMIFEQANKIILIAGLDKIARDRDEALFLAKCMAVFGVEALPLTFHGGELADSGVKAMPFQPVSRPADMVHLILLDNGRRRILQSEYRDLLACIGCRACVKACPASRHFAEDTHLSPREYLYLFLLGQHFSLDRCLQCKICEAVCPLNIDLPGMIRKAKKKASGKYQPISDQLLSHVDLFEEIGSNLPWLMTVVFKNRIIRRLGEKFTGISMERRIPDMEGRSFHKRFRSMEERLRDNRDDT